MSQLKNDLQKIYAEKQAKIISENIKKDVQIFDIVGTYEGFDTSDANATIDDIAVGKTAYVNGEKIIGSVDVNLTGTGTIFENESQINVNDLTYVKFVFLESGNSQMFRPGSYISVTKTILAQAIGLTADKIKAGETILGITGTYTGEPEASL